MKGKKLKLSLDKLNLNKETMFDLSKNDMMGVKGGVTVPTDQGCQSMDQRCISFATNCYSACQGGCDFSWTCQETTTTGGTGTGTLSMQCSQMCFPTDACNTYFPCDAIVEG